MEKPLSRMVKGVYWFVVANSIVGALALIFFPTETEALFFWKITPPINAALVGTSYLVAGLAVAQAALKGRWESARYITTIEVGLSILLLLTTLIHIDRFFPGVKLYYWIIVYLIVPISAIVFYVQYERTGANWQVVHRAVAPATRALAITLGTMLAIFVAITFLRPDLLIGVWPWTISPLMARVFVAWFSALAVSLLWFAREREWTRVQNVADLLIATPIAILLMMLIHREDILGVSVQLWMLVSGLVAMALVGILMRRWQSRPIAQPASLSPR